MAEPEKIALRKLRPQARLPVYANPLDAGMDLFAAESFTLMPGEIKLVHTGVAIGLPPGMEAQIRPRSGLALRHGVTVLNAPGTIDAGYRGEIGVILINHGRAVFEAEAFTRIAQMVVSPVLRVAWVETDDLPPGERGDNGFGSSGLTGGATQDA